MLECRGELEDAVVGRIGAEHDTERLGRAEYVVGIRPAISAALDCGHDVLAGGHRSVSVPPALLVQARLAARHDVPLHTVQRRYTTVSRW